MYGASRGTTEGLLAARGLVLASILGPEAFGGWALFRLLCRYGGFLNLGVTRALEREVVRERAGATGGAGLGVGTAGPALGFLLVVFPLLALLALLVSFAVEEPRLMVALRGFAAAIVLEQVIQYAMAHLRSQGDLKRFATLEMAAAGLHLALAGALALVAGLPGALTGFALTSLVMAGLVFRGVPHRPVLQLEPVRKLLRIGFPISLSLAASFGLTTVDRLVVVAVGGTTMLGYYAFAVAVATLAGTVAWVIRTVIFPDVYGSAHRDGTVAALDAHWRVTITTFAWLYPPLLGVLAILISPVVHLVLPVYAPAVAPAQIFIFCGAAFGLTSLGALAIVAADRQKVLPLISGGALLLNAVASWVALRSGLGLTGVAAGALLSQSVYAGGILMLTARSAALRSPTKATAAALFPLLYCAAAVVLLRSLVTSWAPAYTGGLLIVFLLLLVPLAPFLVKAFTRLNGSNAEPS